MTQLKKRIGFMQGRLTDIRDGRIQSFPWGNWEEELNTSQRLGFELMEWTIDKLDFDLNPLVSNPENVYKTLALKNTRVESVTCDSFMEEPFWQVGREGASTNLRKILKGMAVIGAKTLVVPLVDNSSLSKNQEKIECVDFFLSFRQALVASRVNIAFEVDTNPEETCDFINNFPSGSFGINYDIGNSASLGFNPTEEFTKYGERIINVHVKDRKFEGHTVPLGEGDAQMALVFQLLNSIEFDGNYILQTARSKAGNHAEVLTEYLKFTEDKILDAQAISNGGITLENN